MKALHIILTISLLALIACRSGDSGDELSDYNPDTKPLPQDSEILTKIYDIHYQVPESFYTDARTSTPGSYTVYHVKDISASYELCTNSYDEALAWEANDNDNRAVYGDLVGAYENEKYFEFIRELSYPDDIGNISLSNSPGFARIFKCDYVNLTGTDSNLYDGYAGILRTWPTSSDAIRIFSEYMWQFTFWPNRKAVIETISVTRSDAHQHTLVLAFAINQGTDKCELIEVVEWVFTLNREDGEMTKEFNLLRRFESQLVNGIPELCGS